MQFFKAESERDLWLKLKTEFNQEFQRRINHNPNPSFDEIFQISKNQLEYDEKNGNLRISLDKLLTFTFDDYLEHIRALHKKLCKEFEKLN